MGVVRLSAMQFETEKVKVTSLQRHKRILLICQDIIFAASNGRVKPPKNVSLAVAVKSLTASSKLVGILNGFGHCISDSQTRGLETKIAEKLIAEEGCLQSCISPVQLVSL